MIRQTKNIRPFYVSVLLLLLSVSVALGQTTNNTSNNSTNNNNNSSGDSSSFSNSGVRVDASGVLSIDPAVGANYNLGKQRIQAALSKIPRDVAAKSSTRFISLNRLEKAIADNGGKISNEMWYMAGLLRMKYVFFYPESGDIVVGGPAEGWVEGRDGAIVGYSTGRPMMELGDMVVALRAYPPNGSPTQVVGCSIDPTPEGLVKLNQFIRSFGTLSNNQQEAAVQKERFVNGIRESLGYQNVRVDGISPNTHLAQVLIAADYRMKLIGLGMERHNVSLVTYVEKADPAYVSRNALTRWYFVPDYESVKISADRFAMELVGNGVKLVDEAEVVTSGGDRQSVGSTSNRNRASRAFVKSFTDKYPQIADEAPVFGQLRNVIDMLVCAAHIQKEGFYEKSGWDMEIFGSEEKMPLETFQTPEKVASVVARVENVSKGLFSAPVSGGVVIQPTKGLESSATKAEQQKVVKAKDAVKLPLAEGQWWWDAK